MAMTKSALSNDEWWHVTYPLQPIFRHQIAGLVRLALMLTSDAFLILKIQRVLMTWVQGGWHFRLSLRCPANPYVRVILY